MTLKELDIIANGEIYIMAQDNNGPTYLITDYLRGSRGFMSLEISKLDTYKGLDFLAHVDMSPVVLDMWVKESDDYYKNRMY